VVLDKSLEEALRTLSVNLALRKIGMGDLGMAALATLVSKGRMQRVQKINLSNAREVTDKGIIALAQATKVSSLPCVQDLNIDYLHEDKVTQLGLVATSRAFVNSCPRLVEINLTCRQDFVTFFEQFIKGLLRIARRTASVYWCRWLGMHKNTVSRFFSAVLRIEPRG